MGTISTSYAFLKSDMKKFDQAVSEIYDALRKKLTWERDETDSGQVVIMSGYNWKWNAKVFFQGHLAPSAHSFFLPTQCTLYMYAIEDPTGNILDIFS